MNSIGALCNYGRKCLQGLKVLDEDLNPLNPLHGGKEIWLCLYTA